jgi:hypothetical protein
MLNKLALTIGSFAFALMFGVAGCGGAVSESDTADPGANEAALRTGTSVCVKFSPQAVTYENEGDHMGLVFVGAPEAGNWEACATGATPAAAYAAAVQDISTIVLGLGSPHTFVIHSYQ